jgi:flagellin
VTYTVATLDITAANVDDTVLADMISNVDATVEALTTAASDLGSSKQRINMQSEFVGDLMNAIDRGIGKLVDADMTEESTRLQALQVQQQLGVQSLSIANGNAQTILSLFR